MVFIAHTTLLNKNIQSSTDEMGLKYFDYPPQNLHNMELSRIHIPLVGKSTCDARIRFEIALNQACRNHFKPDLGGSNYIL